MRGTGVIVLISALAMAGPAASQGISVTETESLRLLYFDPSETYLVPRVIQTFHDSLDQQQSILGYVPTGPTTVLLTDFADYGNAGAMATPHNAIFVDVAPRPFTFETTAPAERMYTLMNHEMVHVATIDHAATSDLRARRFFQGKVVATAEHPETIFYQYLTSPRNLSPRWFLEGIAVFQQTWMAGGLGRAQGGYDEMVFRAIVRDDAHFYDPLGLVAEGTQVDFQVGANAYLYGGRFMNYLAYTYGPDKLVDWVRRTDNGYRRYENDFERVYGISLNDAWDDWIEFEKEFQQNNLAAIREYPTTPYEPLAESALGSVSRNFYDPERNSLIGGVRYPGVVAHIAELSLNTGEMDRLRDIKGPMIYRVSSVAYDDESETVFYTADNYAWRDLMAIDLETRETRMLLRDARIGEIVFNRSDRSLWGVRHLNGYASLVRIPYPYTEWNLVRTFPYGSVVYDLDLSPDGSLLSGSFGEIDGSQTLRIYETSSLLADEFSPAATVEFGLAIPEGFVFSPDGRYLYGSSYYTGVSNIFRYELESGDLEAMTNAESGFFRPVPLDDGNLIAFHYTGQGFVPVRIAPEIHEDINPIMLLGSRVIRTHPQLADWQVRPEEAVPAESRIVSTGTYTAIENMGVESVYPIVLGYKDSVSVGIRGNFSDPVRLDTLSMSAAYSTDSDLPSDERLNLSIDYRHAVINNSPLAGTWRFGARLNNADFYDLFGPTQQSRRGNRFFAGFDRTLLYDEPRRLTFSTEINHYSDMDALPRYQNVVTTFDELSTLEAGFSYEHLRRSLGAVDDEKGFLWNITAETSYVDGDAISRVRGNFDFGFALPWGHSSIWIRNAVGAAFGDPNDEFANFYFGGFGNNYVDRGSVKRYRDYYAMPGFELNAIPGRNFHRGMIEWNLPPIRFDRVGTPDFYLSWARPAVFASNLVSNLDRAEIRNNAWNVGIQIDFRFTILSRLDMTLSTGYARGDGEGSFTDEEWMVSLKIM